MQIPNHELPLERMSEGLAVSDAVGTVGDTTRLWDRILSTRIDCCPAAHDVTAAGMVTFMSDDGHESTYTLIKPVFDNAEEVFSCAIISSKIGESGRMTLAQLLEVQAAGWEIANHTRNHYDLTTLSDSEIEDEIGGGLADLEAVGLRAPCIVYPLHKQNSSVRRIAAKYHICARGRTDISEIPNPDAPPLYALVGYQFDNVANVETQINVADTNNQWLIIYVHDVDEDDADDLATLVAYVQGKSMPIVTLEQGMERLGCPCFYGDPYDGLTGGFSVTGRGDAKLRTLDVMGRLRLTDDTYPESIFCSIFEFNADLYIAPNSTSAYLAAYDCNAFHPRRSSGGSRRVVGLGRYNYEWKYVWCVGIAASYSHCYMSAEDECRFYVANEGSSDPLTGILAFRMREDATLEFIATTATEPDSGHAILYTDSNGDVYVASNVGGTSKKKKIMDYATADAW